MSTDETVRETDQVPLEVDPSRYVELGQVAMVPSPDGGPGAVPAGDPPPVPGEGLTAQNLVCTSDPATGRLPCRHYRAILTDALGQLRGVEEQPQQIRRFCTQLATQTELWDLGQLPVRACLIRESITAAEYGLRDVDSQRLIENFEERQRRLSRELSAEHATVDL